MRNDEVNLTSLVREGVKTRQFKGRMAGKGRWISDIQDCDQHQLSTRGSAVLHQQDVIAPLRPAVRAELISHEGTCQAELVRLITPDHTSLQPRSTDEGIRTVRRTDHVWSLWLTSGIVRSHQNLLMSD